MRVIAGDRRSIPLVTPKGFKTRPTSDKIKETLFNILQGYVANSSFLDLFSGSGQIGIEALSRGARFAGFIESSKDAVKCIEANIEKTKFKDRSLIIQNEVLPGLRTLENKRKSFDLIFMDPPYSSGLEKAVLEMLSGSKLLNENAIIIVESAKSTDFSYLHELNFTVVKDKTYKNNKHIFIKQEK